MSRLLALGFAFVAQGASADGMTAETMAAFRQAIGACWMVDPAQEAGSIAVKVGFALTPEGLVVDSNVTLIGHSDGAPEAVEQAFQAARRAVLRCQGSGYDLPADLYDQWRDVELIFDPGGVPSG